MGTALLILGGIVFFLFCCYMAYLSAMRKPDYSKLPSEIEYFKRKQAAKDELDGIMLELKRVEAMPREIEDMIDEINGPTPLTLELQKHRRRLDGTN